MTYSTKEIEDYSLPLPITQTADITAQRFSLQQPNPEKAEQVRLNTLAVYAVHNYLQLMGIPTELTAGDSWNPVMRLCTDVADLEVIGKESLGMSPSENIGIYVPCSTRSAGRPNWLCADSN